MPPTHKIYNILILFNMFYRILIKMFYLIYAYVFLRPIIMRILLKIINALKLQSP